MKKLLTNIEDNELWQLVKVGNEPAFEGLYRRYFQVLFSYGLRVVKDEELVNDAIQDLFVDIWRMRKSLSQAQSVKFYLMSSLRRKIYKSLKPEQLKGEEWEKVSELSLPTSASPEEMVTAEEEVKFQSEKINLWLQQLPPRQNEALVLRFYHNFEYAEIADLLQIKEQTARNLVQKALQILRNLAISLLFNGFFNFFSELEG